MATRKSPIIIFPGANGKAPGTDLFGGETANDVERFRLLGYPRWQACATDEFSVNLMISSLVDKIAAIAPHDPICIIGISIGGHVGYAAALRLQASGRKIGGFCAVDTFMVASAAPRPGWQRRALSLGLHLVQKWRFDELAKFTRARFWRLLLRLSDASASNFLNNSTARRYLASIAAREPIFEEELSVRLLLRKIAPWVSTLDIDLVPLRAPAFLVRTAEAAADDLAWERRCPGIESLTIPGTHQTMFDAENAAAFREVFLAGVRTWREVET